MTKTKAATTEKKPGRFHFHINHEKYNWTNAGPYLCAFFIPIFIMLVVFIIKGIFPFGEKSFLRTDLYHQYAPFYQELKTKFSTGGSLMYTWDIGGGTNFMAIVAYYLASPLNWLLYLCPQSLVIEFITYFVVIKIGLASLTMTYYLNKRSQKHGNAGYFAAFFGIFYGLSGYMAAYSWNVMWLDCILLFPIVILGLERLVKENKGLMYCVALGLTILSNYYIAIMVCLGIACYCFFLLGTEKLMRKQFIQKLLKFIGFTLLAFAFSAVVLIPYIMYFPMTASSSSTFPTDGWYTYFSVFDMISRHFIDVDVHIGLDHWPNIYCGVAIFLTVPLFYLNKKISLREKIGYTVLILFFFFSFSVRTMEYIWHGFHFPNSLPARQSFIYIFFLLAMGYRGLSGLKDRSFKELSGLLVFALGFVFLAEKLMTDETYYDFHVFYLSAVFIIIYLGLMYAYRKRKLSMDILMIVTFTVIAVETCINTCVTSVTTVTRSDYIEYDEGVHTLMSQINEKEGNNFFRTEKLRNRTKNDGAWLTYHSVSTFSSTANKNLTAFYKELGLESSTNAYGSMGQTFFTNMLMGIKYSIATSETTENGLRTLYGTNNDNVYIYENTYSLPLGYMIDSDVADRWTLSGITPLDNQNTLAEYVSGVSDLFENVTPDNLISSATVTITAPEDGYYYAYSPTSGPSKITASHSSTEKNFSRDFENLGRSYTMDLEYCQAGEIITFTNSEKDSTKTLNINLYRLDEDKLKEVYEAFAENTMTVDSYTDTTVTAHIDVAQAGTLLTTIPYEFPMTIKNADGEEVEIGGRAWTVLVDGHPVDYSAFEDAYISLELTAGEHTIEFFYTTPGLYPGIILTVGATLVILIIFVVSGRRNKKQAALMLNEKETDLPESTESTSSDETDAVMTASSEEILADNGAVSGLEQEEEIPITAIDTDFEEDGESNTPDSTHIFERIDTILSDHEKETNQ